MILLLNYLPQQTMTYIHLLLLCPFTLQKWGKLPLSQSKNGSKNQTCCIC